MSKENRRIKYELYKGTSKLSDALKREFEGDERTAKDLAKEGAKAKAEAEKKLKEDLDPKKKGRK